MKSNLSRVSLFCAGMLLAPSASLAQGIVHVGKATIASQPPAYKARTDDHEGFNASKIMTRSIFADELAGRPIPTNDWWTDLINSRFSGAMWSYPAVVHTGDYGVRVSYPSYWADAGKEVKFRSSLIMSGVDFTPQAAIATDWHDLDVVFRMPDMSGAGEMRTTMAHGMPFTWFEFDGLTPEVQFSDAPELFMQNDARGYTGIRIDDDLYGLYYRAGAESDIRDGRLRLYNTDWAVVALLTDVADLTDYRQYAVSVPRDSRVDWRYDAPTARITTTWNVSADNLADPSGDTPVLLGLLPHVYKYAIEPVAGDIGKRYLTPRGQMRMYSVGQGGVSYSYRFGGMTPTYAAPCDDTADGDVPAFSADIMQTLMSDYAAQGTFGRDTYWGGKGLVQMALNMTFAKQCGDTELYELSKTKLREAFEDWFTYTPGEDGVFFSCYPRWGGVLGFNVSYDSDAFNDHHFHYGYFTYAGALLCMEDSGFAADYGDVLSMIARDYANYDRDDHSAPFMRTLDPWSGHSWAGGFGDAGNDNGNGQESSSEAMQAWGGMLMLGVALGDDAMRDAGIWGWSTEARATREYWFDVDAPRPANAGGRKAWAGKGDRSANYDFDEYPYAYNSNITGKGIGWWTWFGGDPLFMHGIQWMPASPVLDYLSWDPDFVAWAYDDMMSGANSTFSHKWFDPTYNTVNNEEIQPLADNDWGSVTLTYLQRTDPAEAARIFERAWHEGRHIARSVSTSHISYYLTHHSLSYGQPDPAVYSDMPTANACLRDGVYTYMVYNPDDSERTVTFYRNGAMLRSVIAPARRLTAFTAEAVPHSISMTSGEGLILPPGDSTQLTARVLDQYDAGVPQSVVSFSINPSSAATITADGRLSIATSARKGSTFTVTATSGDLSAELMFMVNDRPVASDVQILGVTEYVEKGTTLTLHVQMTDQYGNVTEPADMQWSWSHDGQVLSSASRMAPDCAGLWDVTARSASFGDVTRTFVVTPVLGNIARGCRAWSSSEENAGSKTSGINDGTRSTRWGSAHSEDEWVVIDLGRDSRIFRVGVDWEAAYGADYDLQTALDGCAMTTYTGSYAGQQQTVTVPAESAWSTAAEVRGNSSPGLCETKLDATGRYIRMRGIRRGSAYGYSIYEMTVHGIALDTPADALIGLDISLPQIAVQGSSTVVTARGCRLDGGITDVDVTWAAEPEARFDADGEDTTFVPLGYGAYAVTATTTDGFSSSGTTFVEESERLSVLTLTPSAREVMVDDDITITVAAQNQFGGQYTLSDATFALQAYNAAGIPLGHTMTFDNADDISYHATARGNLRLVITVAYGAGMTAVGEISLKVVDISEANLALGKRATSSASLTGNEADHVCDGDIQTRWESPHTDGHWVRVDLADIFLVDRVNLYWEGAYASEYVIQTSLDGDSWTEVYTTRDGNGGVERLTFEAVPARYVRVYCVHRGTAYGNSIYELEVYGQARVNASGDYASPVIDDLSLIPANGSVDVTVSATDDSGFVFYDIILGSDGGAVYATRSLYAPSGEAVSATFGDIRDAVDYLVTVIASDVTGNTSRMSSAFTGILDITGRNLALGRPAVATSHENAGIGASYAVDGRYDTRWGSEFRDGQSLTVDLGDVYSLTEIRVYWDDVAYATDFTVDISEDDVEYMPLYSRTSWTGEATGDNCRLDTYRTTVKTYGRFVRVTGMRRATQYGSSIRELEVYGDNDFSHSGIDRVSVDGYVPVRVYSSQGILLRTADTIDDATVGLAPGIYLVGSSKVIVR